MENIKIVIWDLDETFWKGTLSEENITLIKENIEIIKTLVDRGIMNTISSKNDYAKVRAVLEEMGMWEYFIFPHINWEPKGQQIQEILNQCSLRPVNALFIDDNLQNLNEAKYYNKGINIATPDVLEKLLDMDELKGKLDIEHKRLKQYKILEQKFVMKDKYSSNEEFLRDADIQVYVGYDCEKLLDRLFDLINRSNQLNYTKKRVEKYELEELLRDKRYNCGYVSVKDRYGEYGIVGFFAIINNMAEHFLFSCRTIGMGIEQYVYAKCGYPEIKVVGEVRTTLQKNYEPDWIKEINHNIVSPKMNVQNKEKVKILLSGGCDLDQMFVYMNTSNASVECKFNVGKVRHDNTIYYRGSLEYSEEIKKELIEKLSFIGNLTFLPYIYDSQYDVVIISLLMDYTQNVYRKKDNKDILIAYGDYDRTIDGKKKSGGLNEKEYVYLNEEFESLGQMSMEQFEDNLKYIRAQINPKTSIIFINGCEVALEHEIEVERYKKHHEYNTVLDKFIKENAINTYLLDMRKIVTDREQLNDNIRHYNREIYYKMACELGKMIQAITSVEAVKARKNGRWKGLLEKKIQRFKMNRLNTKR